MCAIDNGSSTPLCFMEDSKILSSTPEESGLNDIDTFDAQTFVQNQDDEQATSKLDVLRAKQINVLNIISISMCIICSVWVLVWIVSARTFLFERISFIDKKGKKFEFDSLKWVFPIMLVDGFLCMSAFVGSAALTVIYLLRVFRNNTRAVTNEQVMVSLEIVIHMVSMCSVPLIILDQIYQWFVYSDDPNGKINTKVWFVMLMSTTNVASYMSMGSGILLYTWIRVHMFSIFKSLSKRQFFVQVILPKLFIYVIYQSLLLFSLFGTSKYGSSWAFIPFSSLACMLINKQALGFMPLLLHITGFLLAGLELVMICGIVHSYVKASKILRATDYFKYRSRIVGFRFFILHSLIYVGCPIIFCVILALGIPPGFRLQYVFLDEKPFYYNDNNFGTSLLLIVKLIWILITAYVSLPPDSVGIRGWFRPYRKTETDRQHLMGETEPVFLSLQTEPAIGSNIFCLPDTSLMFNLSWVAYNKTREELNYYSSILATSESFEIMEEDMFDTKVIIANLLDRIVVAFRGTTTSANVKTDLQTNLVPVKSFLPTMANINITANRRISNLDWKNAKAHQGFLEAYQAISERLLARIQVLLSTKSRPMFLTGHSLGGALATVCSLDLMLCDIFQSNAQVIVSTFGSPKCGNKSWVSLYNNLVPCHWRVYVGPDIVTKFPGPGFRYFHVGKSALLTTGGNLILDPSALDLIWSSEAPSMMYHKKPSYKMALTVICNKLLDGLDSGIWSFPVPESYIRIWETKSKITFSEHQVTTLTSSKFKKMKK